MRRPRRSLLAATLALAIFPASTMGCAEEPLPPLVATTEHVELHMERDGRFPPPTNGDLARFDLIVEMLSQEMRLPIDGRFNVAIVDDASRHCEKGPACYSPDRDLVVVSSLRNGSVAHELVHAFTRRNGIVAPRTIEEGQASLLGGPFQIGVSGLLDPRCFSGSTAAIEYSREEFKQAGLSYDGSAARFVGNLLQESNGRENLEELARVVGYKASTSETEEVFFDVFDTPIADAWETASTRSVSSPYGCVAEPSELGQSAQTTTFDLSDGSEGVENLFSDGETAQWRTRRFRVELELGERYLFDAGADTTEWRAKLAVCGCHGAFAILGPGSSAQTFEVTGESGSAVLSLDAPVDANAWLQLERQ